MLPSKGYFKNEPCPYYEGKSCERPYCHFRHKRYDKSVAYLATLRAALDDFELLPESPEEIPELNGTDAHEDSNTHEESAAIPTADVVESADVDNSVTVDVNEEVKAEENVVVKELTPEQLRDLDEIINHLKTHPSRIDEILSILRNKSKRSDRKSSSRRKSSRSDRSKSSHRHSSKGSSRKRSSEENHPESNRKKSSEENHPDSKRKKSSEESHPESNRKKSSEENHSSRKRSAEEHETEPKKPRTEKQPSPVIDIADEPKVIPAVPRFSALMSAANATKPTRICPVANVSRMLRAPTPVPKITVASSATGTRVEHSNSQWCPFLENITEGSFAVPAAKRNVVLQRLYAAFNESRMFFSKSEAGQEAVKCESDMFGKHRDCTRKYHLMLPSVLTAIKQRRYLVKNDASSDESEWYNRLLPLVLNEEQLVDNGFPLETINESDGAIKVNVFHNTAFAFNRKWKSIRDAYRKGLRYCVRCNMEYKIDETTKLQLIPNCVFHSEKIRRQRGDRFYPCCNGDAGCQTETYHVTDQLYEDMDLVVKSKPPRPGQVYQKVLALDCEMIATTHGMELAHVVFVNMNGGVVYEAHVKPMNPVTSYLTQFSGMSEELLEKNAKKDLIGIQKDLMEFITSETILIGHSLDSDLRALRLVHTLVIDTSVLYPPHEVNGDLRKQSLKRLAALHLMRAIQDNEHGHSALEDAVASLELAKKKVEPKFNKFS